MASDSACATNCARADEPARNAIRSWRAISTGCPRSSPVRADAPRDLARGRRARVPHKLHRRQSTDRGARRASPIAASSASFRITPLGLLGVAKKIARVRALIRRRKIFQIGAEALLRGLSGAHHARAADFDGRGVGRVHRIKGDDFIARAGDAQRRDEQRILRAGKHDDVFSLSRLLRAQRRARALSPRAARAVRPPGCSAYRRRAAVRSRDRRPGSGCRSSGSPTLRAMTSSPRARAGRPRMRIPGVRAIAADPVDQSGELHIRKTPHRVGGQKCSPHITVPR